MCLPVTSEIKFEQIVKILEEIEGAQAHVSYTVLFGKIAGVKPTESTELIDLRPPARQPTPRNLSFDGDLNHLTDDIEPKQKGITELDFRPFCRFESRESHIEVGGKNEKFILHRHFFVLLALD